MTEYNFIESPFPGANGPFENAPGLQPTTPDRGGRPRGEMRLPWSFPVRLGGSRGGGLPDQRPLAQFPLWPSLFASMRFMGPGEYRRGTGTGTSCPVRLGSPTGDSRREVEPPGRRLRAASAAPARRDFIRISNSRREEERRLTAPSRRCWRLRQSVREAYSGEQAKEGGW